MRIKIESSQCILSRCIIINLSRAIQCEIVCPHTGDSESGKSSLLGHGALSYSVPECISAGRSCSDFLRVNNKKIDLIRLDNLHLAVRTSHCFCVRLLRFCSVWISCGLGKRYRKVHLPRRTPYLLSQPSSVQLLHCCINHFIGNIFTIPFVLSENAHNIRQVMQIFRQRRRYRLCR